MASAVKAKGRPPGAKTVERPATTADPPRCPNHSCRSTRQLAGAKRPIKDSTDFSGVRDGEPYNRVIWYATTCADCGQRYRFNVFLYEPDRKPETPPERPKLTEHLEVHAAYFKQAEQQTYFLDGPHELTIGSQLWRYGRLRDGRAVKAKAT